MHITVYNPDPYGEVELFRGVVGGCWCDGDMIDHLQLAAAANSAAEPHR